MLFNGNGPLTFQVASGDTVPLFATTDVVVTNSISKVIAPVDAGPVSRRAISFACVGFGATIFGSNTYPTTSAPQNGVSVGTPTAGTTYTDTLAYAFYWAVAAAGSPGSVIAHVS